MGRIDSTSEDSTLRAHLPGFYRRLTESPSLWGACGLRSKWCSHRANATGALRVIQGAVSDSSAHEETDKARALRTKHGPLGCGGDVAPRIAAA